MSEFSKKNKAVALKYDPDSSEAPVIIASGSGHSAERIIDVAEKMGIPVYRDDSAASLMCMLQVGSSIPPELYQVVAGIYCHLLEVSSELKSAANVAVPQKSPEPQQSNLAALSKRIQDDRNERP